MKKQRRKPQENDWLFSCPEWVSSQDIIAATKTSSSCLIELSAKHWNKAWGMANDVLTAYDYPSAYFFAPQQEVGWDALYGWVLINIWKEGQMRGELFVIRKCLPQHSSTLALLLDVLQSRAQSVSDEVDKQHIRFPNRVVTVVLAGWNTSVLEGRVGSRQKSWTVNAMAIQEG